MPYIPTEPVESSNIEAVGYDRKTSTLRIIFQGNRAYDYPMFPEQEFKKLLEAESKGKFFNTRIKPMYAHRTPRPEELEPPAPCCIHSKEDDWTCTEACFRCYPGCGPSPEESANAQEEELVVVPLPLPFWAPVGARPDGTVPSTTTHFHGYEMPKEHDHEDGDECHVHDADGLSVEVPPPALPTKADGSIDYGAIPVLEGWKPIDPHEHPQLESECCDAPADAPPSFGCCHGAGSD